MLIGLIGSWLLGWLTKMIYNTFRNIVGGID